MEDYAARRREYVQQVRASFDEPASEFYLYDEVSKEPAELSLFSGFKMRLSAAIALFGIAFFCQYYSYPILGMEIPEIIDRISDNQYYTFLENCDILKDIDFLNL